MPLKEQIEKKLNQALKEKDKNTYPTLRLIVSTIKDAEIANMLKGNSKKDTLSQDSPKEKKDYVPFAVIENVPVYPGCYQGTNEELKSCMSLNIFKSSGLASSAYMATTNNPSLSKFNSLFIKFRS